MNELTRFLNKASATPEFSRLSQQLEKAKKMGVWTQPSGRVVTRNKAGKIVPYKGGVKTAEKKKSASVSSPDFRMESFHQFVKNQGFMSPPNSEIGSDGTIKFFLQKKTGEMVAQVYLKPDGMGGVEKSRFSVKSGGLEDFSSIKDLERAIQPSESPKRESNLIKKYTTLTDMVIDKAIVAINNKDRDGLQVAANELNYLAKEVHNKRKGLTSDVARELDDRLSKKWAEVGRTVFSMDQKARDQKKAKDKPKKDRRSGPVNESALTELNLYAENDAELYRQRLVPTINNMKRKIENKTFDAEKAPKLTQYFVDAAAKKYVKEFASGPVGSVFNPATREAYAKELAERLEREIRAGEHGELKMRKAAPWLNQLRDIDLKNF